MSVLLGNGNGIFQAPVNYAVGTTPTSVTLEDFNGDGKPDLAVSNQDSNNVSVLLGNLTRDDRPVGVNVLCAQWIFEFMMQNCAA